jgi:aspartate-semialdehyde dehydrogenase
MAHPKSPSGLRLGLVNPMTLVGNEIKMILRERGFPFRDLVLLDSSGQSAGALTEMDQEPAIVAPVSREGLDNLDLVFFCGPPATNREWIERHREDAFIAVELSQPTSVEEGRLAVAGLNIDQLSGEDEVIISPHPIAVSMALILHQVASLSEVESCTATVIQPASEFGQEGIEELAKQTVSVLNVESMPKTIFDRQLAFNLYPSDEGLEKVILEQIRALINPKSELALLITQGTIFHGHTFSMFIRTKKTLDPEAILEALSASPAIALPEGDQQFGTIDAAGRDEVLVAAIRPDESIRGGFWVWAVCDNLRRASALNAVLIAEQALSASPS